jgi:SAM-dependent methyltransferase
MFRYALAACALRASSANSASKKLYRKLGNTFGLRQRLEVRDIEIRVARGNLLVALCRAHNAVIDGDHILELGPGWMHWYSLYLRFFYDVKVTGIDVWDNRQFKALQAAAKKLEAVFECSGTDAKVIENVRKISRCSGFEDLYQTFGYEYVLERTGALSQFSNSYFNFITSFHVLEHIPTQYLMPLANDMYRTLKPGALTIHQIGIDDHLTHYDRKASQKQYLKYSDRTWRIFFENEVQHINRLQPSDWQALFKSAGFVLLDKITEKTNIDSLRINSKFREYPKEDLECTILTYVYQKPVSAS